MSVIQEINENPAVRERYTALANAGDTNAMMLLGAADEALGTVQSFSNSSEWRHKALKSGMIEAGYFSAKTAATLARHFNHSDDTETLEERYWDRAFSDAGECYGKLSREPENAEMIAASQDIMKEAMYHLSLFAALRENPETLKVGVNLFETISTSGERERLLCAYAHIKVFKDVDVNSIVSRLAELSRILSGPLYGQQGYVGNAEKKEQRLYALAAALLAIAVYKGIIGNNKDDCKTIMQGAISVVTDPEAKKYLNITLNNLENNVL